jgi:AGCS family alanine or glycine:cation symporter
MGSAPNAAAAAETSHPVKQGVAQILSVFIDTVMICSTSAFIILLSGIDLHTTTIGIPLMQQAIKNQVGEWGIHFITFSVTTFAFSAIIGNFGISESNILFIKDNPKVLKTIRIISILPIIFGCIASAGVIWNLADISMATIATVNIVAIILLSNRYMICLNDYMNQRKHKKDPVFNAPACGINDTELWK